MTKKRKTDSWGHPALTYNEVVKIAENLIPEKLRPYYVGIDVMKYELSEPYSEWNTDIELMFKYPVTGIVDDARYAHGSLWGIKKDFEDRSATWIDLDSKDDPARKEWDEAYDTLPTKRITKMRKRIRWHKPGFFGD